MKKKVKIVLKIAVITLAFFMDYAEVYDTVFEGRFENPYSLISKLYKILISINTDVVKEGICVILLFILLNKTKDICLSLYYKIIIGILAMLAAVSFFIGNQLYMHGDTYVQFTGCVQIIKSILIVTGYAILFYEMIKLAISSYKNRINIHSYDFSNFFKYKYMFWKIMIILMVAWLGILWVYYPAMFMGDTEDIIYMAFNYETGLASTVERINESVFLTNHHPVLYTVIIGTIIRIARMCGASDNIAIFICALLQCILSAAIATYSIIYCNKELKRPNIAMAALCFYILCPWIPSYVIMISKDTLFADFLMLFAISVHKILKGDNRKKTYVICMIMAVMVVLFRKNGFYIIILTFALLIFRYKKDWKKWLLCITVILAIQGSWNKIVLPTCGISQGSIREALSVPFQQTARYVRDYPDEVTKYEKETINRVLEYESLAEVYNSNLSDPVKATFRIEADRDDLRDYFKVWLQMLIKHPETYIVATVSNYYGYFYPIVNDIDKIFRTSVGSMQNANRDELFAFHNYEDNIHVWVRDGLRLYNAVWMKIPFLNIFITSAFYVWVVIAGMAVKIAVKDRKGFICLFVYFILILTDLIGPCNAIDYERYIYPCIMAFPYILCIVFDNEKAKSDKCIETK